MKHFLFMKKFLFSLLFLMNSLTAMDKTVFPESQSSTCYHWSRDMQHISVTPIEFCNMYTKDQAVMQLLRNSYQRAMQTIENIKNEIHDENNMNNDYNKNNYIDYLLFQYINQKVKNYSQIYFDYEPITRKITSALNSLKQIPHMIPALLESRHFQSFIHQIFSYPAQDKKVRLPEELFDQAVKVFPELEWISIYLKNIQDQNQYFSDEKEIAAHVYEWINQNTSVLWATYLKNIGEEMIEKELDMHLENYFLRSKEISMRLMSLMGMDQNSTD